MKSGVYLITNMLTGEKYVGSSRNITNRWRNYKCESHRQKYIEKMRIYKDITTYGIECFSFSVLKFCPVELLRVEEQFYIDTLKPEYNSRNALLTSDRRLQRSKELESRICTYNGKQRTYAALRKYFKRHNINESPLRYLDNLA